MWHSRIGRERYSPKRASSKRKSMHLIRENSTLTAGHLRICEPTDVSGNVRGLKRVGLRSRSIIPSTTISMKAKDNLRGIGSNLRIDLHENLGILLPHLDVGLLPEEIGLEEELGGLCHLLNKNRKRL